jgi:hypothetical protein
MPQDPNGYADVVAALTIGQEALTMDGLAAYPCRILKLDSKRLRVFVHFDGWNARYVRILFFQLSPVLMD